MDSIFEILTFILTCFRICHGEIEQTSKLKIMFTQPANILQTNNGNLEASRETKGLIYLWSQERNEFADPIENYNHAFSALQNSHTFTLVTNYRGSDIREPKFPLVIRKPTIATYYQTGSDNRYRDISPNLMWLPEHILSACNGSSYEMNQKQCGTNKLYADLPPLLEPKSSIPANEKRTNVWSINLCVQLDYVQMSLNSRPWSDILDISIYFPAYLHKHNTLGVLRPFKYTLFGGNKCSLPQAYKFTSVLVADYFYPRILNKFLLSKKYAADRIFSIMEYCPRTYFTGIFIILFTIENEIRSGLVSKFVSNTLYTYSLYEHITNLNLHPETLGLSNLYKIAYEAPGRHMAWNMDSILFLTRKYQIPAPLRILLDCMLPNTNYKRRWQILQNFKDASDQRSVIIALLVQDFMKNHSYVTNSYEMCNNGVREFNKAHDHFRDKAGLLITSTLGEAEAAADDIVIPNPLEHFRFVTCGQRGQSSLPFHELVYVYDGHVWMALGISIASLVLLFWGSNQFKKTSGLNNPVYVFFWLVKVLLEQGDPFPSGVTRIASLRSTLILVFFPALILSNAYKNTNVLKNVY